MQVCQHRSVVDAAHIWCALHGLFMVYWSFPNTQLLLLCVSWNGDDLVILQWYTVMDLESFSYTCFIQKKLSYIATHLKLFVYCYILCKLCKFLVGHLRCNLCRDWFFLFFSQGTEDLEIIGDCKMQLLLSFFIFCGCNIQLLLSIFSIFSCTNF